MVSSVFTSLPVISAEDNSTSADSGIEQWEYSVGDKTLIEGSTYYDIAKWLDPDSFVYHASNGVLIVKPTGEDYLFGPDRVKSSHPNSYFVIKMHEGTEPDVKEIKEKINAEEGYEVKFYRSDVSNEYIFYIFSNEWYNEKSRQYENDVLDMLKSDSNVIRIEKREEVVKTGFCLANLYVTSDKEPEEFIKCYPNLGLELCPGNYDSENYEIMFSLDNYKKSPESYKDLVKLSQSDDKFKIDFMFSIHLPSEPQYLLTEPLYDAEAADTTSEIMPGDIYSDGIIDLSDLSTLSLFLVGDNELTNGQKKAADIDHDDEVTLADLAKLRQYLSKKIDTLDTPYYSAEKTFPILS